MFTFRQTDAAGQGMAKAFALLLSIVLWFLVGGLLFICAARNGFPGFTGFIALAAFIAAVAGHFASLSLLGELYKGDRFEWLVRCVLVAIPCSVILYSAWNFFPGLRSLTPAGPANLGMGLAIILVSAIPWLVMGPSHAMMAARDRAIQEAWDKQQNLVKEVDALPADTPFAALISYAYEPKADLTPYMQEYVHSAAIGRMRKMPSRQEDVERLLAGSDVRILSDLGSLELTMTVGICEGGRKCARIVAEKFKPPDPAPPFESVESDIKRYVIGIRWLADNGCDCKSEIAAIEQTVRLYPFSYPRTGFTDSLREMRGKPREP